MRKPYIAQYKQLRIHWSKIYVPGGPHHDLHALHHGDDDGTFHGHPQNLPQAPYEILLDILEGDLRPHQELQVYHQASQSILVCGDEERHLEADQLWGILRRDRLGKPHFELNQCPTQVRSGYPYEVHHIRLCIWGNYIRHFESPV